MSGFDIKQIREKVSTDLQSAISKDTKIFAQQDNNLFEDKNPVDKNSFTERLSGLVKPETANALWDFLNYDFEENGQDDSLDEDEINFWLQNADLDSDGRVTIGEIASLVTPDSEGKENENLALIEEIESQLNKEASTQTTDEQSAAEVAFKTEALTQGVNEQEATKAAYDAEALTQGVNEQEATKAAYDAEASTQNINQYNSNIDTALDSIRNAIGDGIGKNGIVPVLPEGAPDFSSADKVSSKTVLEVAYCMFKDNNETLNNIIENGDFSKSYLNTLKQENTGNYEYKIGDIIFIGKDGTFPAIVSGYNEDKSLKVIQGGLTQNGVQNGIFEVTVEAGEIDSYIPLGQESLQKIEEQEAARIALEAETSDQGVNEQEATKAAYDAEASTQGVNQYNSNINTVLGQLRGAIGDGIGKNGIVPVLPEGAPDFSSADKVSSKTVLEVAYCMFKDGNETLNNIIENGDFSKSYLNTLKHENTGNYEYKIGDIIFIGKDGTFPAIVSGYNEDKSLKVIQGGLTQNGVQNGIFEVTVEAGEIDSYIPLGQESLQKIEEQEASRIALEAEQFEEAREKYTPILEKFGINGTIQEIEFLNEETEIQLKLENETIRIIEQSEGNYLIEDSKHNDIGKYVISEDGKLIAQFDNKGKVTIENCTIENFVEIAQNYSDYFDTTTITAINSRIQSGEISQNATIKQEKGKIIIENNNYTYEIDSDGKLKTILQIENGTLEYDENDKLISAHNIDFETFKQYGDEESVQELASKFDEKTLNGATIDLTNGEMTIVDSSGNLLFMKNEHTEITIRDAEDTTPPTTDPYDEEVHIDYNKEYMLDEIEEAIRNQEYNIQEILNKSEYSNVKISQIEYESLMTRLGYSMTEVSENEYETTLDDGTVIKYNDGKISISHSEESAAKLAIEAETRDIETVFEKEQPFATIEYFIKIKDYAALEEYVNGDEFKGTKISEEDYIDLLNKLGLNVPEEHQSHYRVELPNGAAIEYENGIMLITYD